MMYDLNYVDAMSKSEHLIALNQTTIYLRDETEFPWDKVTRVESGSAYRLGAPASMYVVAQDSGLEFKLNIEFEGRDANGRGVALFERERLRDLAVRLPKQARESFASLLANEVLPGMAKRTAEIREAMNSQLDSEDCVRGLISFMRP